MPKIDDSHIIYPGSLTSCGFDEPGEHGMCVGRIYNEDLKNVSKEKRKELIEYSFVKVDETKYEKKTIDVSNFSSVVEAMDKLDLKDDFYKIYLIGNRNIDVAKLKEGIKANYKNVCQIEDNTNIEYDLEKISKQDTLIGIFVGKMLDRLKHNPENEKEIMSAIEYVLSNI